MFPQPSPLLVLVTLVAVALPTSAIFGLIAAWAFRQMTRNGATPNPSEPTET